MPSPLLFCFLSFDYCRLAAALSVVSVSHIPTVDQNGTQPQMISIGAQGGNDYWLPSLQQLSGDAIPDSFQALRAKANEEEKKTK